jgi:glycosyltransferase involved in cell wall biosynthesis
MPRVLIFAEFPTGVLSGEMLGRGGGHAATWLPQLAKAWETAENCEIHWCIPDRTTRETISVKKWNQMFHRIPCTGISLGLLLARWPYRVAFRKLLRVVRPDVIHCWGTETLYGAAIWEFKGPSMLSMQGVITTYARTGDLKGWRWKLFKFWEPRTIGRASLVTSESEWGLDQVQKLVPGKRICRVEYGVFPGYYDVAWVPRGDAPRFLFVGGLNRLKGVDVLVEMLRRHPERRWKMAFAGGGYLEQRLRELNDPGVEILGTLKTAQVQEQMANAWALVMPSRADTSPNVVKEARVIGLPVVASPHGGHAEYVQNGVDGRVVRSEDPEEWFAALDELAHDFERCRQMGEVHHARYREYFRPENTAGRFLELYHELGAGR